MKHPLHTYATRYRVSLSTIKRWRSAGVDLDDPAAVEDFVTSNKHAPPRFSAGNRNGLPKSGFQTLIAGRYAQRRIRNLAAMLAQAAQGKLTIEDRNKSESMRIVRRIMDQVVLDLALDAFAISQGASARELREERALTWKEVQE